jgi:hypothetical protein
MRRTTSSAATSSQQSKSSSSSTPQQKSRQRFLCFITILSFAGVVFTKYPQFIHQNTHSEGDIVAKFDDRVITHPLQPQVDTIHGLDHYYMIPSSTNSNVTTIKGILIYLHSCSQSGIDFFHLPENRIIAYSALQKGLAVFAPSSYDRDSGCYTGNDMDRVGRTVNDWTKRHPQLKQLPRVGMGESSGGSFLFFVYKELKLHSMAVYNTPQGYLGDEWDVAIPTSFLTMPLDVAVSTRMTDHNEKLQSVNVTTQLYKVSPRPFTRSVCTARLPELPNSFCQLVFQTIERDYSSKTLLDRNGFVLGNVRSQQWTKFFTTINQQFLSADGDNYKLIETLYDTPSRQQTTGGMPWVWAVLQQEIESCQGYHAMTAEFHDDVLQFLMSTAGIPASTD